MSGMQHVDANAINTDLQARVDYLIKFIEFRPEDAEALCNATPIVKPLVGGVVDTGYEDLFTFDITCATFMARHTGFTGKLSEKLEDINHDSEQTKFRKDFLKVFTADYNDPKTYEYLDRVGVMGTGKVGFKHREKKNPLYVDYAHCAIASLGLLGYVQSMLTSAVMGRDDLPKKVKTTTLLAINKVMWIQNDLFARHYITPYSVNAIPKEFGVDQRVWPLACGGLVAALVYLIWI